MQSTASQPNGVVSSNPSPNHYPRLVSESATRPIPDRRIEDRAPLNLDLWLVADAGRTALRCNVRDYSARGMRLRVPLGYGVAEGQRYELRSQIPGMPTLRQAGLFIRRQATVVRTQLNLGGDDDHLEIGVVIEDEAEV